jgi:metal-responsive CopG/Arc/MetJ family transcriptional regulator
VAKVMISMPDDLLDRLDAQARANRETRSGLLRRLAERRDRANAKSSKSFLTRPPLQWAVKPSG